ncbi:hypothetical protein EVAR_24596_1 [Eumeta japonica]|uniref:Ig-like domain-containing protein n=1 Tax=Eumeta variegata TaxID=151549 RepID=A0A4C1W6M6_EUMVA|nr:hypothetical protein EVAR_24596_1 [Eumeta japonica]
MCTRYDATDIRVVWFDTRPTYTLSMTACRLWVYCDERSREGTVCTAVVWSTRGLQVNSVNLKPPSRCCHDAKITSKPDLLTARPQPTWFLQPETEILGGPDLFIYAGSTINLTCIVRHTPEPPHSITWTHRGKTINFDSTRGGISLVTEKGAHSSSRLLVQAARTGDAGAYECGPDNAKSATARVHVLTGETPAAMQGGARWPLGGGLAPLAACLIFHFHVFGYGQLRL